MKMGFTLIELLVYMAIMGFIIVVAGKVYSDATGMRVRTQNMTKATEEVNKVAELLKEDLSQMGAKACMNTPSNCPTNAQLLKVYANASGNDSSSFALEHATGGDNIKFWKISYDSEGKYIRTDLIKWYVRDKILYRCEMAYENNDNCPPSNEVAMAEGVKTFTLNPSKSLPADGFPFGGASASSTFGLISHPADNANLYATNVIPTINNTIILSGTDPCDNGRHCFQRNSSSSGAKQQQVYVAEPPPNTGTAIGDCKKFNFEKNETYAIKFKTPMNFMGAHEEIPDSMIALFKPGIDHMAVGFRTVGSQVSNIDNMPTDFMFYPPQKTDIEDRAEVANINQYFEFSVPGNVSNACVAFTFAFYSGSPNFGPHKGRVRIKDFELLHKKDEAYEFVREEDANYSAYLDNFENKKNVKAFELILEVERGKEVGSTRKCWKREGNDVCGGYVISVPNNGIVLNGEGL